MVGSYTGASRKYCNMELGKGGYFDGTEVYADETLDSFREDVLIGACYASIISAIA